MSEKILTQHPTGKKGVNLDRQMYEQIKAAILKSIAAQGEIAFQELPSAVEANLVGEFASSIGWYTTTIKLDLEARGLIERIPQRTPQVLRLKG